MTFLDGERKKRLELAAHRAWEGRFVRVTLRQVGMGDWPMWIGFEEGQVRETLERGLRVKLPRGDV